MLSGKAIMVSNISIKRDPHAVGISAGLVTSSVVVMWDWAS